MEEGHSQTAAGREVFARVERKGGKERARIGGGHFLCCGDGWRAIRRKLSGVDSQDERAISIGSSIKKCHGEREEAESKRGMSRQREKRRAERAILS